MRAYICVLRLHDNILIYEHDDIFEACREQKIAVETISFDEYQIKNRNYLKQQAASKIRLAGNGIG